MPETPSMDWGSKIAEAASTQVKFEPLEINTRYNFVMENVEIRTAKNTGVEYINFQAKVIDGPRKNSKVFDSTFPNAKNIGMFLDLYKALGLDVSWLVESNPTLEDIVSAFDGRSFSAEVYVQDNAREDKNGDKYRSLRRYAPQEAPQDDAPAPQTPAAPQQATAAPQAPATPATQSDSPWGPPSTPWGN